MPNRIAHFGRNNVAIALLANAEKESKLVAIFNVTSASEKLTLTIPLSIFQRTISVPL